MPKTSQPKAKQALHEIWQAETKQNAESAFDLFIQTYEAKYPKAVEPLLNAIELLDRAKNWHEAGMSAANPAWAYMNMGHFDQCYMYLDMAISYSQTHSVRSMEVLPTSWLSTAKGYQGDLESAIALGDRSIQIALEVGDAVSASWAANFKAYGMYMAGDARNAIFPIREGIEKLEEFEVGVLMSMWYGWLAEILLELSNLEDARNAAEQSLKFGESGDRYGEAISHRVLAAVYARPPYQDWQKCKSHAAESIRVAEEQKARPEIAMTNFRYAEALEIKGDLDRSRELLAHATNLFKDMGMASWLGKAEALRSRLDAEISDGRPTRN